MRVAVIGSGIAGLAAARALVGSTSPARHGHRERDDIHVTMFEAASRPGGHVYTVDANGACIDMGFIVCNRERYPHFFDLLDALGIATRPTTMSFSVTTRDLTSGPPFRMREWGSASLDSMFAERRRIFDPAHWSFLADVMRFLFRARADLDSELARHASLDEYLVMRRVTAEVRERFVVPLAAALWSLAPDLCGAFPAVTYLWFLEQHGMLSPVRPLSWHTIIGGSRRYVDTLLAQLTATGQFALHVATPVQSIVRDARGVTLRTREGAQRFDHVVIATHANTALALLGAPTEAERRVLGAFRYSTNRTVLHTDRAFLPRRDAAHAAWNYIADPDTARVAVTYSMTKLQGLPDVPYLVTLNPRTEPRGTLHEVVFDHPQFDRAALGAQRELPNLNGTHRTYYAGAHFGFGFHEDGMRSGLEAAAALLVDAARDRITAQVALGESA
jgi:predicted NAD/FAD-binding protein